MVTLSRVLAATALTTVCAGLAASPVRAVGLFMCMDPAGRQVCVVDTGKMTGFSPSGVCNTSCPACAGRCDAARYYPSTTGHWKKEWQVAPGISDNNILTPSPNPQEDARTIIREGLAAPETPPGPPPAKPGTGY